MPTRKQDLQRYWPSRVWSVGSSLRGSGSVFWS
jgi:hypothetical protein